MLNTLQRNTESGIKMKPKDYLQTKTWTETVNANESFRKVVRWRTNNQLSASTANQAVTEAREKCHSCTRMEKVLKSTRIQLALAS